MSVSHRKRKIPVYNYYSIDDAINSPNDNFRPFILSNERLTKDGHIGRYYTVFPHFKYFLKNRKKYLNCHEILVDHINCPEDKFGRLVFDFDIKIKYKIPDNFKKQIENAVVEVVEQYFNGVNIDIIEFIWSSSKNPNKFSKHLTVKNIYFDDWIELSIIFYKLFCIIWDRKNTWIGSDNLLDFQIIKKKGSLRMVGSTKINGHFLIFDNPKNQLTDSLIRIYSNDERKKEQLITICNINKDVFDGVLTFQPKKFIKIDSNSNYLFQIKEPEFDNIIYQKAYEMYNMIHPGIFKMGKINGKIISLIRVNASKCILSSKHHDHENGFCVINKTKDNFSVRFGCFRFCHKFKTIYLGSISGNDNKIIINPILLKTKSKIVDK